MTRSHTKTLLFIANKLLIHWIYHKKDEYAINTVNPLYLIVHEIDGFIEEKEGNKYLHFALTDSNSKVLEIKYGKNN